MGKPKHIEEYDESALPAYTPMPWSLKEIRNAIPPHLFHKNTLRGLAYLARDLLLAAVAFTAALQIDPYFEQLDSDSALAQLGAIGTTLSEAGIPGWLVAGLGRWAAWGAYWWFQGLIFTGIWVIGHECGHGAFSDYKLVNDVVGFITHTFLWTPYFSWRISHHRHHSNHASMERDEVYVPWTRKELGIPQDLKPVGSKGVEEEHVHHDQLEWDELFGDTPIWTLFCLVRQQVLAFPAYLLFNVSGQRNYPKWTNHFDPNSILFTKSQRNVVIMSNIGIATMVYGVVQAASMYGWWNVVALYGIPWLLVSHWFIMITYLHHTDPSLPHYRGKEWNFQRGAAATVDRNFLGWQGRFFLHDVAHFHVIHHFFPKMPFYHGPEATKHLKAFIGEHYAYSDKPVFKALWESYNQCQFVEDEGEVLFYRNKEGKAARRPADAYVAPRAKVE